jgi:hypothetical protein
MKNPWMDLPESAPYVLPQDNGFVTRFNRTADEESFIRTKMMPEPFMGDPDAPVVLLGLNPGFTPDAVRHETPDFYTLSRNNLLHEGGEYPFYLLTPSLDEPGKAWWEQKLSHLIREKGVKAVAKGVLCVEYFPYHSTRFGHAKLHVPSQQYSFTLVRKAMARRAVIVIMRSEKLWRAALPELELYPRLYQLRNPQNVMITENNCPRGYADIVGRL